MFYTELVITLEEPTMQHEHSISQSFGPRAEAYLKSSVHSTGPDLDTLRTAAAAIEHPVVLDLGCGAGHASFAIAPFAQKVVAYDLTESMLEVVAGEAQERRLANIQTQQGSVESLPFVAGEFDWVISRYSAHHWKDVNQALKEIRRVLKPGGQVCFMDVAGGPEPLLDTHLQALELLRDPSHVRNYTPAEWLARFHQCRFDAKISRTWRIPIEFSAWITRIGASADRVAAIRSLWESAPAEVRTYFSLKNDLSFELDVLFIEAHRVS
jgi:ubiquinone/menaquinone biosynthesis C-methylase UbiE